MNHPVPVNITLYDIQESTRKWPLSEDLGMTLKHADSKTINETQIVYMKDTSLPEGLVSRFTSCVTGGCSSASLSNGRLHYEIVCKDCQLWILFYKQVNPLRTKFRKARVVSKFQSIYPNLPLFFILYVAI